MINISANVIGVRSAPIGPAGIIVREFQARVKADGGTFEGGNCLNKLITQLQSIEIQ